MDNKNNISVLICDDSALMRNLIGRIIEGAEGLTLAGKAMNGRFLLQKIPRLDPDVIVLDLEMPEMNGIEFLKERRRQGIDIPVVILSSIARRGAKITMEALGLGASDFIMKPSGAISEDIHVVASQLIEMLTAYGGKYRRKRGSRTTPIVTEIPPKPESSPAIQPKFNRPVLVKPVLPEPGRPRDQVHTVPVEIVAIGISTGGPNALRKVLTIIDPELQAPIVIVQHMPAGFTHEFAKSLDRLSPLEVKEAEDGDLLKPGRVLIAPGNMHIQVQKRRLAGTAHTQSEDPVNGHRPSADVLFKSVAQEYGASALAVIMTGMGKDGARHMGSIFNAGGITVAQDEASSIVYGMPKVATEAGYIEHVVPLKDMADTISKLVRQNR